MHPKFRLNKKCCSDQFGLKELFKKKTLIFLNENLFGTPKMPPLHCMTWNYYKKRERESEAGKSKIDYAQRIIELY